MSARPIRRTYVVDGRELEAELHLGEENLRGQVLVALEEQAVESAVRRLDPHRVEFEYEGRRVRATVVRDGDRVWVSIDGRSWDVTLQDPGAGAAHHAGEDDFAISPMTGLLAKVSAAVGDQLDEGAELFVVEAMKMEYVVRAPRALTVSEVRHAAGEQVEQGVVVVAFEESE